MRRLSREWLLSRAAARPKVSAVQSPLTCSVRLPRSSIANPHRSPENQNIDWKTGDIGHRQQRP